MVLVAGGAAHSIARWHEFTRKARGKRGETIFFFFFKKTDVKSHGKFFTKRKSVFPKKVHQTAFLSIQSFPIQVILPETWKPIHRAKAELFTIIHCTLNYLAIIGYSIAFLLAFCLGFCCLLVYNGNMLVVV